MARFHFDKSWNMLHIPEGSSSSWAGSLHHVGPSVMCNVGDQNIRSQLICEHSREQKLFCVLELPAMVVRNGSL